VLVSLLGHRTLTANLRSCLLRLRLYRQVCLVTGGVKRVLNVVMQLVLLRVLLLLVLRTRAPTATVTAVSATLLVVMRTMDMFENFVLRKVMVMSIVSMSAANNLITDHIRGLVLTLPVLITMPLLVLLPRNVLPQIINRHLHHNRVGGWETLQTAKRQLQRLFSGPKPRMLCSGNSGRNTRAPCRRKCANRAADRGALEDHSCEVARERWGVHTQTQCTVGNTGRICCISLYRCGVTV
jgi:hypothetical protein